MRSTRHTLRRGSFVLGLVVLLAQLSGTATAQRPPTFRSLPPIPLFFSETWRRSGPSDTGEHPVLPANLSDARLSLEVLGQDAKDNMLLNGSTDNVDAPGALNLWSGLSKLPIAALLRDPDHYVDLSGRAKIRWTIWTEGFHEVRPVIRLADGTLLVGDHADTSTSTFAQREFAVTDVRWVRLDPVRIVTVGTYGPDGQAADWVANPDLSRVDAVGWADLMPGSGHGSSGGMNITSIAVYGKSVPRH